MPLNQSELDAARAWIETRVGSRCGVCGGSELTVAADVFILRPNVGDSASGKAERGHHFPLLARVCGGCANTTFFAMHCMGIDPPDLPAADGDGPKSWPPE